MSSSRAVKFSKTKAKGDDRAPGVTARSAPPRLPEVVIGQFVGLDPDGMPLVDYPGNPTRAPLLALTTASLDRSAAGRDVALLFADGDLNRPLVIGLVQQPAGTAEVDFLGDGVEAPETRVDGKRVVLTGKQEIVLKCGRASITLTRAGKVLIRGTYLLNRSSGVNRIKGGSVQIN